MAHWVLNVFVFIFIFLSSTLSYDFKVIQPKFQNVNPDKTASISCEHDAKKFRLQDVRLHRISQNCKSEMVAQKGNNSTKSISMYHENPSKFVFVLLNVAEEEMESTFECEITVEVGYLDSTRKGSPTKLIPGEMASLCSSPPPQSNELRWILIGLLALMFLYSCVITCLFIIRMKNTKAVENATYVVMKPPIQKSPYEDVYHMQMYPA